MIHYFKDIGIFYYSELTKNYKIYFNNLIVKLKKKYYKDLLKKKSDLYNYHFHK